MTSAENSGDGNRFYWEHRGIEIMYSAVLSFTTLSNVTTKGREVFVGIVFLGEEN